MNLPRFLWLLTVAIVTTNTLSGRERPNIIVILSDDMGYSDIGCYGSEIRTPNLDALGFNGLRFSQFYNVGRCCPTRASLLTGLYPHQAGVGHMMNDRGFEGYRGDLNDHCATIAEVLSTAGYANYAAGKWHVTKHTRPRSEAEKRNWPLQRGFDRFYGTIHGAGSFYDPNSLVRDNSFISPYADPEYTPEEFYYTDAISDHAARFIREHHERAANKPFFLYVAYTAAHWPMHALEQDVQKYSGKYDVGYKPIRAARYQKLKELGLLHPNWELTPQAEDWEKVQSREWEARCMEVYAAMIDSMDQGIGRIVESLKHTGQFDRTLILFLQDNGGCAEELGRNPRGEFQTRPETPPFAPMPPEALQENMIPKQTRDGYPVVQGPGIMPGGPDSYIAYGRGWANVSNTPFREYKHWVHEGGISTPLIAHWPEGIKPPKAKAVVDAPAHLIDVMATCVDLAGARYPSRREGQKVHPMQGVSLRPVFQGNPVERNNPLFWEHEGNRAVREGQWKLVAKEDQPWELYDMEEDRTELNNLVSTQPQKAKELAEKWERWAAATHVLPLGAWRQTSAK